jgi:hypothetical protein
MVALAACGTPSPAPPPLEPPGPRLGEVVATLDGAPITLGEVVKTSLRTDYPMMLRRQLLRAVIERERRRLGVENSPEERLRFAQARAAEFKVRRPQEFARVLKESGRSEEDYIAEYARSAPLDARLSNEKIVAYALFAADATHLRLTSEGSSTELWVVRGMIEREFGADAERAALAAEPGAEFGSWAGKDGGLYRLTLLDRSVGSDRPYADVSGEILARIIAEPLDESTIEGYFDWLLSRSEIRYLRKEFE